MATLSQLTGSDPKSLLVIFFTTDIASVVLQFRFSFVWLASIQHTVHMSMMLLLFVPLRVILNESSLPNYSLTYLCSTRAAFGKIYRLIDDSFVH